MSYNITKTNGTPLQTVFDGTVDAKLSTSLTLVGKNYAGYGLFLNENFVRLLENFSNTTEPPHPMEGQIWWDFTNKVLKVRNGEVWKSVAGSTTSSTAPANPVIGDVWWNSALNQLFVKSSIVSNPDGWTLVGPVASANFGKTGAYPEDMLSTVDASNHHVVKFYIDNNVVAIISPDSFQSNTIPGFLDITPGFNLTTTPASGQSAPIFNGDAKNAINLAGVVGTDYLNKNLGGTIAGAVTFTNTAGVGLTNDLQVASDSATVNITSTTAGKDLKVKMFGQTTESIKVDKTTGNVWLKGAFGLAEAATVTYVNSVTNGTSSTVLSRTGSNTITGIITADGSGTRDFGSGSVPFKDIYANNFRGTADNSLSLGGVLASNYITKDAPQVIAANFTVGGVITAGLNSSFTIAAGSAGANVILSSNIATNDVIFKVKDSGNILQTALTLSSAGYVFIGNDPTTGSYPLMAATRQYVDSKISTSTGLTSITTNILPSSNNTYNVGSPSLKWASMYAATFVGNVTGNASTASKLQTARTINGVSFDGSSNITLTAAANGGTSAACSGNAATATTAGTITNQANSATITATSANTINQIVLRDSNGNFSAGTINAIASQATYADLAERYAADTVYEPGTVVMLGGTHEITICNDDLSDQVFGVISQDPAYLMNNDAGSDMTHPPVALQGRILVRVVGTVSKGDRLVSAGNGVARAAKQGEASTYTVLGRAIENKVGEDESKILAVVSAVV